MNELEEAREGIKEIDLEMSRLFEKRMRLAEIVYAYKSRNGLPVYDAEQEAKVIASRTPLIEDPVIREYYSLFLKEVMSCSRAYQTRLMEGMKIAYSGVKGAFADIAARKLFPGASLIPCPDFDSAYAACERGDADVAVLPIENSNVGVVGRVMDLTFHGSLYINMISELSVTQNLLGVPGARIGDIRKVLSHPQALSQCATFISEHGMETEECTNTAVAAQQVAALGDRTLGAIASIETASLYGLEVLEKDICSSRANVTRFASFSRSMNRPDSRDESFTLMFTVRHEAGALAKALNIIGSNGFNMNSRHSRPLEGPHWHHYFFAELEGNAHSSEGEDLLRQLGTVCAKLKLVGTYKTIQLGED